MFCQNCGKQIPDGSTYCNECGAVQGTSAESAGPETPPVAYTVTSWILFAIGLVLAVISFTHAGDSDRAVYKGIIKALASLVYIPAIKIKALVKSPFLMLVVKVLVVGMIVLIL